MKNIKFTTDIQVYTLDNCAPSNSELINAAKKATKNSYAPYSNFSVGAAVLLANGTIVIGGNQENAAYPSGLCAERVAIYSANAQYPDQAVKAIAVAASHNGQFTEFPCTPCGSCRQSVLEVETRFSSPIRIIMYGEKEIYEVASITDLLPLSFGKSALAK